MMVEEEKKSRRLVYQRAHAQRLRRRSAKSATWTDGFQYREPCNFLASAYSDIHERPVFYGFGFGFVNFLR
jgi:hypothetical protein